MSRIISYSKAINEAMIQEMERDPNVFVLGEDPQDNIYAADKDLQPEIDAYIRQ